MKTKAYQGREELSPLDITSVLMVEEGPCGWQGERGKGVCVCMCGKGNKSGDEELTGKGNKSGVEELTSKGREEGKGVPEKIIHTKNYPVREMSYVV